MVWVKRLFKFMIFAALVLAFLLFVLSMLGGNSDNLKKAMEDFLSESTHTKVTIEKVNHIGFYPSLTFDMEGINGRGGEAADVDVFSIGALRLSMSFWDMTFSTSKVRAIDIRNINLAPGLWGDAPVKLEYISIFPAQEAETAALKGQGMVGEKPFSLYIAMDTLGPPEGPKYRFSPAREIDISLGDAKARLTVQEDEAHVEPLQRGEDYCALVALLLDLDIKFSHNCPLPEKMEKAETVEAAPAGEQEMEIREVEVIEAKPVDSAEGQAGSP